MRAWTSWISRSPRQSGSTSGAESQLVVAALQNTPRETGLDIDTSTSSRITGSRCTTRLDTAPKSGSAEVYLHEMPGGQHNLKEQAAAMGPAPAGRRSRAPTAINDLFGDIVKVTPSSKVVGDLALFLFTKGIKPTW